MAEANGFIYPIVWKIYPFVTSALETRRIVNLRMVLAWVLTGDKVNQRNLSVSVFPFEMIQKSRFIMARDTGYIPVRRYFPGFNIRSHIVTHTAKTWRVGNVVHDHAHAQNENKAYAQQDEKAFFMLFDSLCGIVKKIFDKPVHCCYDLHQ